MVRLGHRTVVAHNVIFIGTEAAWRMIPGTRETDIRLIQLHAVDESMAAPKLDGLSRQTDDPLHIHDADARGANGHHISPTWLLKRIGEAIHKIDTVVLIGRQHAAALDANWQQDKAEYHRHCDKQDDEAHHGPL